MAGICRQSGNNVWPRETEPLVVMEGLLGGAPPDRLFEVCQWAFLAHMYPPTHFFLTDTGCVPQVNYNWLIFKTSDFCNILSCKLHECGLMCDQTLSVHHNIAAQCLVCSNFYLWNFWIHRDTGRGLRVREIDLFLIRQQFGSNPGTRYGVSCPQVQSSLCTKDAAPCRIPAIRLGLLCDLAVWA